jgi:hypothetical protein
VLEPENPVPAPDAAVETPVDTPVVEPAAPSEEFVPPVEPTTNPDVSPVEPQPATNADTVGEVLPSGGIDTSMSTTTVEGVVAEPSSSSTDISSEVFIQ